MIQSLQIVCSRCNAVTLNLIGQFLNDDTRYGVVAGYHGGDGNNLPVVRRITCPDTQTDHMTASDQRLGGICATTDPGERNGSIQIESPDSRIGEILSNSSIDRSRVHTLLAVNGNVPADATVGAVEKGRITVPGHFEGSVIAAAFVEVTCVEIGGVELCTVVRGHTLCPVWIETLVRGRC